MNYEISRKVDELGRIVLPIGMRKKIGLKEQDELLISTEGQQINLRKRINNCFICENENEITKIKNNYICMECLKKLQKEKLI